MNSTSDFRVLLRQIELQIQANRYAYLRKTANQRLLTDVKKL